MKRDEIKTELLGKFLGKKGLETRKIIEIQEVLSVFSQIAEEGLFSYPKMDGKRVLETLKTMFGEVEELIVFSLANFTYGPGLLNQNNLNETYLKDMKFEINDFFGDSLGDILRKKFKNPTPNLVNEHVYDAKSRTTWGLREITSLRNTIENTIYPWYFEIQFFSHCFLKDYLNDSFWTTLYYFIAFSLTNDRENADKTKELLSIFHSDCLIAGAKADNPQIYIVFTGNPIRGGY